MQIHNITSLLDQIDARLVVLLCHHNADPDAIGAASAFSSLLGRLRPQLQTKIAAAEGPSRLSKHVLTALPIRLTPNPPIEKADAIVLLDTNTIQQLNGWAERVKAASSPIIVIDHHASHPETKRLATLIVVDDEASSTCEIIYRFFKDTNSQLSEAEAKSLLLGIAFDTRHFTLASSASLKIAAELIDSGVNVQEVLPLLTLPMEESERIARLKASKRVKLLRIGRWIVAFSDVGAYQASAARALISLGAHLAIVTGQRDKRSTISMRATQEFYQVTGFHLGRDLAKPLGECIHGMGGGHALSAGVNGASCLEACRNLCIKLLKEKLGARAQTC